MFSLPPQGKVRAQARAEARTYDLHGEEAHGPLDGELLDLYVALLIVVPLAWMVRSVLF